MYRTRYYTIQFFEHMEEFGISPAVQKLVRATRDVVPDIYQYMVETKNCAEKINVFLADLSDKEILREELSSVEGLAISSSMYNNLEINAEAATKGNALLCWQIILVSPGKKQWLLEMVKMIFPC